MTDNEKLSMSDWLIAVERWGVHAPEHLIGLGYRPNVIEAKAEKSSRKGYTDYGVAAWCCWLTDAGRAHLRECRGIHR